MRIHFGWAQVWVGEKDAHVGKKEYSKEVSCYCILGDGHIASGGYDDRIKIW